MSKITKGLLVGLASTIGLYYFKNPNEAKKHKDFILDNLKGGLDKLTEQSSELLENTVEGTDELVEENIVISEQIKDDAQKKLDNLIAAFDNNVSGLEVNEEKKFTENNAEPEYEVEEHVIDEESNEVVINNELIEETLLKENYIAGEIEGGIELKETLEDSIDNVFSNYIEEKEPTLENSLEDQEVSSLIENYEINEFKEELAPFNGVEVLEKNEVNLNDVIEKVKEEINKEELSDNVDIEVESEEDLDSETDEEVIEEVDEKVNEAKSALESIVSLFSSKK